MDQEKLSLFRLHMSPGIGRTALFKLQKNFGSFRMALTAPPEELVRMAHLPPRLANSILSQDDPALLKGLATLKQLSVRLISFWDENYPAYLRHIHDPPALLYLRGTLPVGEGFAIVGSRRATAAGLQLTREISADLAQRGVTIISGLARGIDTAAHHGALQAEGNTIAVLGCGIDCVYPPENLKLFQMILERNAVVSEFPPGIQPLAGHFPGRNRIISGLSRGVLVVEAAAGSGSLITGDFALEQGRELFAVPGGVKNVTSFGPNRLIKEGAQLVTGAEDILQSLWPDLPTNKVRKEEERFMAQLEGKTLKLYQTLDFEPQHADELGRASGLTPMEVSAILLDLELRGGVQTLPGGRYIRSR
ncbi:DNA-processing protein DprA [Geopsychrobacter electrodiphilus]|uniref:DNA-processing protein DprA n=1 Tax=Geopsychrobacter electrodiphilus TaxID=225196 RepID=UPI00035C1EB6|nr:DNA-processing protein DprA [Geopsychrobacter electrodiphilus]